MLKSCYQSKYLEAGCDEAGRGCLAGPVYAAAVILPGDYTHSYLNDSKQLSAKMREKLRMEIEKEALAWAVKSVDAGQIDRINIVNASFMAVHLSLESLSIKPGFIIMDGNRFTPYQNLPYQCIVKGDSKYLSIAAASVLAKTYRDEFMRSIHNIYPEYQWDKNKGYPTKVHRKAIVCDGLTPYHRKTFRLLDRQLVLDLKFTSI